MGMFTWRTADTGRTIGNIYSDIPAETVYLLQPGGAEPVREDGYEGYGVFGGMDVFQWLGRANLHMVKQTPERIAALTEEEIGEIGATLDGGGYYVDQTDGTRHAICHAGADLVDPGIMRHPVTYDVPIAHFGGKSGNQLIQEGRLVEHRFTCDVPLKFSHDPRAVYEDLPRSPECPSQGFMTELAA